MSREESEQSERLKSDINDLLEKKLRVRGSPVWSLPHDYYSLNMDLNMFISAKFQRDHLGPLLEQAAQDTEATAWIAANDRIAFECLSFLEKRKIAVPRRISVVGFDDTIEAMFQGLTSFNFNETAAVKAAISFVVNPGTTYKQAGFRSGTHRIDGYLVERNSCSKTNKYGNG